MWLFFIIFPVFNIQGDKGNELIQLQKYSHNFFNFILPIIHLLISQLVFTNFILTALYKHAMADKDGTAAVANTNFGNLYKLNF